MPFAGLLVILIVIGAAGALAESGTGSPAGSLAMGECKTGNQTLFFSPHPMLDSRTVPGFSDSLSLQLRDPLRELGYCLEEVKDYRAILDTARYGDNLVLQTQAEEGGMGSGAVSVALLHVRELARGRLSEAVSRPLVSLRFGPGEVSSLANILAKKISENLRSQFVADLLIRSHPDGALARTPAGMEGRTPVEWVMPLGNVTVTLVRPGYLPLTREMDLSAPGLHAYDLQMVKRRFYHSKFIYPTLAAGAVSLVSFGAERHFYAKYQALGEKDQEIRPEAFGQNFGTAKTYERLAYTMLGLALLNLTLCYTF